MRTLVNTKDKLLIRVDGTQGRIVFNSNCSKLFEDNNCKVTLYEEKDQYYLAFGEDKDCLASYKVNGLYIIQNSGIVREILEGLKSKIIYKGRLICELVKENGYYLLKPTRLKAMNQRKRESE
ncbi:hypothetical protein M2146_001085 [Lachnospiraceae bacterium PF1-22]